MTEDNGRLDLSRRKLLGSVATIGAAGAIGGAGSMAFFSDEENFANNELVAGELDLKIDWEEHYSDWIGEETDFARMPGPDEDPDYLLPAFNIAANSAFSSGLDFDERDSVDIGPLADGVEMAPMDGRPIELVFTGDPAGDDDAETPQDLFWNATAIEAYPDSDDDGVQDQTTDNDENTVPDFPDVNRDEGEDICDTDSDLPSVLDSDLRTEGSREQPLISLDDVKPGDFGEVTFSFHLCDNPGYVWLTGDLVDADENGNTEPESVDEDEYGPDGENFEGDEDPIGGANLFDNEGDESNEPNTDSDDTTQERVELLDYVLTRVWRDDGNNQVDQITGELDVVCAIDTSGSLDSEETTDLVNGVNQFITALGDSDADVQVGTLQFGDDSVSIGNTLDDPGAVSVSSFTGSGDTPMPGALEIADQQVRMDQNARPGAEKIIVLFTDGGPNYEPDTTYNAGVYSAGPFDQGTDNGTVSEGEMAQTKKVADGVKAGGTQISTVYVGADGEDTQAMSGDAISTYTDLPTYLATSGPIASSASDAFDVDIGNLTDLANELVGLVTTAEEVIFLGTLREALQAVSGGAGLPLSGDIDAEEGGGTGEQGCFEPSTTQYIGFEWWLPINHGNQVQGDSATFDLGFYTEQCRHNDGSGQVGNT